MGWRKGAREALREREGVGIAVNIVDFGAGEVAWKKEGG